MTAKKTSWKECFHIFIVDVVIQHRPPRYWLCAWACGRKGWSPDNLRETVIGWMLLFVENLFRGCLTFIMGHIMFLSRVDNCLTVSRSDRILGIRVYNITYCLLMGFLQYRVLEIGHNINFKWKSLRICYIYLIFTILMDSWLKY